MFKDYYAILRVPFSASAEQVRASFKKLALLHHPDRTIHQSTTDNFSKTEPMQTLKEAQVVSKAHDNHCTHSAAAKSTNEKMECKPEEQQEPKQYYQEEQDHSNFTSSKRENEDFLSKNREAEKVEEYGVNTNSVVEFTDVTEAYEVLSDVARRYLYDLNYVELREICHRQREREKLQAQLALAAKKMKAQQRYKQYCQELQEQKLLKQQQQQREHQQQQNEQIHNQQLSEEAQLDCNTLSNKELSHNFSKCNATISPVLETTFTNNITKSKGSIINNVQHNRNDDVDDVGNRNNVPETVEFQNSIEENASIIEKSTNSKLNKCNNNREDGGNKNTTNASQYCRHESRVHNFSNTLPILVASKKVMSLPITSKSLNLRHDFRADSNYAATNFDTHIDAKAAATSNNTNKLSLPALKHAKLYSYTHHNINVQQRHQRAIRNTVRIFFARELGLTT